MSVLWLLLGFARFRDLSGDQHKRAARPSSTLWQKTSRYLFFRTTGRLYLKVLFFAAKHVTGVMITHRHNEADTHHIPQQ